MRATITLTYATAHHACSQERINARVRYIEGDMAPTEAAQWAEQFAEPPPELTREEKAAFLATLSEVTRSHSAISM